jgi:hypothetical protein
MELKGDKKTKENASQQYFHPHRWKGHNDMFWKPLNPERMGGNGKGE